VSPHTQAPRRRPAPDTQPGLPMAIPASGMPERVLTEASTSCSAAFDADDWLFSVDWEGSRCLLIAGGDGSIRLQGGTSTLDDRFPEIVEAAASAGLPSAILDGVVCILDDEGRPDLEALARRSRSGRDTPTAVYLATDLVHLGGESLTARPLLARLGALAPLVPRGSRIQLPDHVTGHGRALAAAATERGLAGMLARRQDASYLSGMASPDRLRIPLSQRRDAVVVGWRESAKGLLAVLADWTLGRLGLVGVTPVEHQVAAPWLTATVDPFAIDAVLNPGTAGPGVTWSRPRLVATVEPAPRGDRGGLLPEWRLVALRDDVDPMWCVRRPPVDPPRASASRPMRPFSPTVLSALPFDRVA
jgi:bifunctional non-homologous end joining protein LigD